MNINLNLTATEPPVAVDHETEITVGHESGSIYLNPTASQDIAQKTVTIINDKEKSATPITYTYQRHPINIMLPGMSPEDFRGLKENIRLNGLKVPVLLHEGMILDGWHRYQVCLQCGIAPKYEDYVGTFPAGDCWARNIVRRHLEKSQLAALAVTFMPSLEKEAKVRQLAGLKQNRHGDGKKTKTKMDAIDETLPEVPRGSVRSQLSKVIGVGESYIQRAKKIRELDKTIFEKILQGKMTVPQAKAEICRKTEAYMKNTDSIIIRKNDKRCSIFNCDLLDAPIKDGTLDAIICDPPYVKENLDCWTKLAKFAVAKLKEGGSLLAMGGVYYLPEEIRNLTIEGLNYYWTLCYYMDKGCYPKSRKVKCNWKPVLWYVKEKYNRTFQRTDHFADPYQNCAQGKRFHKWGQSVPFFSGLVEQFTYADELVCDPFLGGGTTAIAALSSKRRFVGVELDAKSYRTSMSRIQDWESGQITDQSNPKPGYQVDHTTEMKLAA